MSPVQVVGGGAVKSQGLLGAQGGKTVPKGKKKKKKRLHFEICVIVSNWGNSLFFFRLEGKKKYQVTSVKEEVDRPKHSTNYSGWRKPPPARELIKTIDPC